MTGSTKWPASRWSEMLADILPILNHHRPGSDWWSFGGGTALAVWLDHRISYDIDLFVDSSRDLRALTPQHNPLTKALQNTLPSDFPGHYLKLHRPQGEIDIIVASFQTDPGFAPWLFQGHSIRLETPVEIAIKKIFYRPSTFKIRDIFDVAAILDAGHGPELAANLPTIADRLPEIRDRLDLLQAVYDQQAPQDIHPTPKGGQWLRAEAVFPPLLALI